MNIRKIAGTAALAGAIGAAALGLGAGSAQADDIWVPDIPWIPWGAGHWIPDPNLGPPGQVKKWCPAPFDSPPGHWYGGPHGIPCT
ncbi:MAG: hypothetical protein WAL26_27165 [Mycobacterium sp.]